MVVGGETREAAGHHPIAAGRRDGVDADAECARREVVGVLVYQTGACEKAMCSWATKAYGRARIRAISSAALLGGEVAAEHGQHGSDWERSA